eukprot:8412060-Pyramimonas_sp.AAC.1
MHLTGFVLALLALEILLGALTGGNVELFHHSPDADDKFIPFVVIYSKGQQRSDLVNAVPGHIPFLMGAKKAGHT